MASCTAFCISPIVLGLGEDAQITWADDDYARPEITHVGLGFYSRFPEPDEADVVSDDDRGDPSPDISADSYPVKSCTSYGAPLRLRGGCHSDESGLEDGADESDEPESDSAGPSSKRKRKTVQPPRPRKRPSKGKGKASDDESDSETAIR
ncbi:hypothetical protein DFH07DRAFT_974663 [Mycena maculata]|uniref:Uncharacterized protein n=1 Tax=Mycena maculata TaxID=230809 RepID=A0AAD7H7A2_9AGAR|nr:hypothetical protein DFH07DRAFT_974663 [Mycena maculata]